MKQQIYREMMDSIKQEVAEVIDEKLDDINHRIKIAEELRVLHRR